MKNQSHSLTLLNMNLVNNSLAVKLTAVCNNMDTHAVYYSHHSHTQNMSKLNSDHSRNLSEYSTAQFLH